jgi:hypothetical protein
VIEDESSRLNEILLARIGRIGKIFWMLDGFFKMDFGNAGKGIRNF